MQAPIRKLNPLLYVAAEDVPTVSRGTKPVEEKPRIHALMNREQRAKAMTAIEVLDELFELRKQTMNRYERRQYNWWVDVYNFKRGAIILKLLPQGEKDLETLLF